MAESTKFIPGSDAAPEEIFTYPFFNEEESKHFIKSHGKIMFIIRGPPGTGKNSLADLIKCHFPTGVKCSADDYFSNTFNSHVRTRESLKQSHFYCHKRVEQECVKSTHPVIVSNTHMKKREMQKYLDLAAQYEYTVIITSTLDKFKATPEILAKSNTKGLGKDYFAMRLKAWQDVYPILMGWFLCPDDTFCVLQQLKFALDALLGDGKFCRTFNAFDSDTLLDNYKTKRVLFCIAGYMKSTPFELREYYKSSEVRNAYGKYFTICIEAFVVTKSDIFAVVPLHEDLKKVTFKPSFENIAHREEDLENIVDIMQSTSLLDSYNFKLRPLTDDTSQKAKTILLKENSSDHLNIHESSFIHLAQGGEEKFSASKLNKLLRKSFTGFVNANGEFHFDQLKELDGGYAVCLLNNGWMVKLPQIVSVKTVFTGLYM